MAGPRVADSSDDVGQIPTANDKDHNVIIMGRHITFIDRLQEAHMRNTQVDLFGTGS